MLDAVHVAALQLEATQHWHTEADWAAAAPTAFEQLVLEQHRANFDLWHREDQARDPGASDSVIATVKRSIDRLNQRRNDLVERLDDLLLSSVQQANEADLHSETPGLIVDRLSILALKVFHTQEEVSRVDATEAHRVRNRQRLAGLEEQRRDLVLCLVTLWQEVHAGRRRFKLYRQFKMYNDPTLNPVLYGTRDVPAPRDPSTSTEDPRQRH